MRKTCVTLLTLLICVQVCAHGPLNPRVMGGVDAQERAWPWMVSLLDPTCHFCGGSLISRQWVLSAAHCFFRDDGSIMDTGRLHVYLGKIKQNEVNTVNEIDSTVQAIYTHASYSEKTKDNDIALLLLSSPVAITQHISPVPLVAHGSDFPVNTESRIIGWGQTAGVNLAHPGTLQEATVFVVDNTQCQTQLRTFIKQNTPLFEKLKSFFKRLRRWKNPIQITQNMICAGVAGGGAFADCGDSGGPIMSDYCSNWVQSGITSWGISWGIGCGLPDLPSVYTRVSQYEEWITKTIKKHPGTDLPNFVKVNTLPCPSVPGTMVGK